jgi:hypothetical protein
MIKHITHIAKALQPALASQITFLSIDAEMEAYFSRACPIGSARDLNIKTLINQIITHATKALRAHTVTRSSLAGLHGTQPILYDPTLLNPTMLPRIDVSTGGGLT